jgi:hypothetical protein
MFLHMYVFEKEERESKREEGRGRENMSESL